MSYIRFSHPYVFVDGESDDYIIPASDSDDGPVYIKSYGEGGSLSNATIMEFVCRMLRDGWRPDELFSEWFIGQVAVRLDVRLRSGRLSLVDERRYMVESLARVKKDFPDLMLGDG